MSGGAKQDEDSRKPGWLNKKADAPGGYGAPKTALAQQQLEKKKQEEEQKRLDEQRRIEDEKRRLQEERERLEKERQEALAESRRREEEERRRRAEEERRKREEEERYRMEEELRQEELKRQAEEERRRIEMERLALEEERKKLERARVEEEDRRKRDLEDGLRQKEEDERRRQAEEDRARARQRMIEERQRMEEERLRLERARREEEEEEERQRIDETRRQIEEEKRRLQEERERLEQDRVDEEERRKQAEEERQAKVRSERKRLQDEEQARRRAEEERIEREKMRLRQQEEEERRKFEEERRKMDEERAQMEKEKEDFRKKKEIDDIETFLGDRYGAQSVAPVAGGGLFRASSVARPNPNPTMVMMMDEFGNPVLVPATPAAPVPVLDPRTGMMLDANTGMIIDSNTGMVIAPSGARPSGRLAPRTSEVDMNGRRLSTRTSSAQIVAPAATPVNPASFNSDLDDLEGLIDQNDPYKGTNSFKDELDQLTALSPPPPPPEPTGPAMFDDLNDFLSGPPISAAPELPCALCKNMFPESTLKEMKNRQFCQECHDTVTAKLRERGASAGAPSNAINSSPRTSAASQQPASLSPKLEKKSSQGGLDRSSTASSSFSARPSGDMGSTMTSTMSGGGWNRTRPSRLVQDASKPGLMRNSSRSRMTLMEETTAPPAAAPQRAPLPVVVDEEPVAAPLAAPAPPPEPELAPVVDEIVACAMCKNSYGKSTCVDVKGRAFCTNCHLKFMAQVEARKKQLQNKA